MKKYVYFCLILFLLLLPLNSARAAETENTTIQAQSETTQDSGLTAQSSKASSTQSSTADTTSNTTKSSSTTTATTSETASASTTAANTASVTTADNKTTTSSTTQSATVTSDTANTSCVITVSAGNGQLVLGDGSALSGTYDTDSDLSAIILPNRGYTIPESVTITSNGTALDASSYSYSSETGVLTLPAALLESDSNLTISFSCIVLSPVTTVASSESTDTETVTAAAAPVSTEEVASNIVEASENNPDDSTIDTDWTNLHAIYLMSAMFCAGGALYLMLFILHKSKKEERMQAAHKPAQPIRKVKAESEA